MPYAVCRRALLCACTAATDAYSYCCSSDEYACSLFASSAASGASAHGYDDTYAVSVAWHLNDNDNIHGYNNASSDSDEYACSLFASSAHGYDDTYAVSGV